MHLDVEKIIPVLRRKIRFGFPPGELVSYLRNEGYTDEEVEEIKSALQMPSQAGKEKSGRTSISKQNLAGSAIFITGLSLQPLNDSIIPNGLMVLGLILLAPAAIRFIKRQIILKPGKETPTTDSSDDN